MELVTATIMNAHIRDNLNWLFDPSSKYSTSVNEASNYTTTSTTFADIDAAGDPDLSQSVTTSGEDLLIIFVCECTHSAGAGRVHFDIAIDAVRLGGDDGITTAMIPTAESTGSFPTTVVALATGLSAGAHVVSVQWKASGATATIYAGAGTVGHDTHPQLIILAV